MEVVRVLIGPDGGANTWQLCARAVLLFIAGVGLIRIAGHRAFARASPFDIVLAIIIGSNLSRALTGGAPFFGSLAASLVLALLRRSTAWATRRPSRLGRLLKARPVILVRNGVIDHGAVRRKMISRSDLFSAMREEQVARLADVRLATLERSGKISVLPRAPEQGKAGARSTTR